MRPKDPTANFLPLLTELQPIYALCCTSLLGLPRSTAVLPISIESVAILFDVIKRPPIRLLSKLFFPQIHGSEDKHINNAFEVRDNAPPLDVDHIFHSFTFPL
jgi:hypothetical protein